MTSQSQKIISTRGVSIVDRTMVIYVNIGVPCSKIPIMQKVSLFVELEKDTILQVVKRFREKVASNIEEYGWERGVNFDPSVLYYEVYEHPEDSLPRYASEHAPSIHDISFEKENTMDELLFALRQGNRTAINACAIKLLVTNKRTLNKAQAQEFERYAPCRIIEWQSTPFKRKPYIASIIYNSMEYGIG